jgi:hypothetical protein
MRAMLVPRAAGAVVAIAIASVAAPARASFSADEERTLDEGGSVVHTLTYARGDHRYVGGIAYRIVDRPADQLSRIARDVSRSRDLLPNVVDARLVSLDGNGVAIVSFEHAIGPFSGSYTLAVQFSEGGNLGRFWIQPTPDGVVADGWGFVRLTTLATPSRTLVTYALLFELDEGIVRTLFETRIRNLALEFPTRLAHAAQRP